MKCNFKLQTCSINNCRRCASVVESLANLAGQFHWVLPVVRNAAVVVACCHFDVASENNMNVTGGAGEAAANSNQKSQMPKLLPKVLTTITARHHCPEVLLAEENVSGTSLHRWLKAD
jgi:hypothetical protein